MRGESPLHRRCWPRVLRVIGRQGDSPAIRRYSVTVAETHDGKLSTEFQGDSILVEFLT